MKGSGFRNMCTEYTIHYGLDTATCFVCRVKHAMWSGKGLGSGMYDEEREIKGHR
jgi:hypothetical protein